MRSSTGHPPLICQRKPEPFVDILPPSQMNSSLSHHCRGYKITVVRFSFAEAPQRLDLLGEPLCEFVQTIHKMRRLVVSNERITRVVINESSVLLPFIGIDRQCPVLPLLPAA